MKKLLTIITKLELGGAQQVVINTLKSIPKDQYQCFLISGKNGFLDQVAMDLENTEVQLWGSFKHPIRPLADLITLLRLIMFIKKNEIDIVHTHSSKAGFLGRLAAKVAGCKKIIHTVHGWPFHEHQSFLVRSFYIILEKMTALMSDKLIAVSEATRDKGIKNKIGRMEQYEVVYPGSDLTNYGPGIVDDHMWLRETFNMKGYPPVVGMIACLKPQKAPLDFVRAALLVHKKMPAVRFLLAGDGPLRKKIEKEIKRHKMEEIIIMAGWRQDIDRIMKGLTLMVLTSLWEGLPCVFGQAMKTGLAIIATNVEGAAEAITDNETGILVPKQKTAIMAKKILEVLNDQSLRIRLGKAAMKQAYRFGIEETVQKTINIYNK